VVVVVDLVVVVVVEVLVVEVVVVEVMHSIWYRSTPQLVASKSETKLNAAVL
jgi:hypothetical protein